MVREYYQLIKPGIMYSNAIAALAGFLLASQWNIDWLLLLVTIAGVMFVIASACVCNNYIDRGIDVRMKRTKKRALVSGVISGTNAIVYCIVLGLIGFLLLSFTNALTFGLGVTAYILYVVVYGYFKRTSVYGTLVGSVSGALPPVAGYTAVTGSIDLAAVVLFLILTAWQMPHFYAIAMFRRDDYAAAKIPVLPVVRGMKAAKREIFAYIVLLAVVAPLLTVFGYAGIVYAIIAVTAAGGWVVLAIRNYSMDDVAWARKMFFYSLGCLLVLCFAVATAPVFV
ncbi:protoheme IX farnesyltransferase [Candidatus Saccharibacteria bacterium RIFCSPHIGHO2_01_FULL_45_15]|nr:MAG: protoheme IX farnesyltransferase [Candidatus Saccharibacteria bacterium RIFCSPHIGHO2_01_FULL_45_15]OGL31750.1 MAG: protoheme IX farnesyltransferase [Candidatus Saccharibacteria bacterium RIFCSPHIGHO2_12_FULL_44_22]